MIVVLPTPPLPLIAIFIISFPHDVSVLKYLISLGRCIDIRMRFPKRDIEKVSLLVRHHMFYYPSADWRKENEQSIDKIHLEKLREEKKENYQSVGGWTDAAIRRFIARIGGVDNLDDLIMLRIADASANPKSNFTDFEIDALQERISKVIAEDSAFKVSDLAVNGHDLMGIGIQGKEVGRILNELLEKVIEDPALNEKDQLLEIVKTIQ